MNNRSMAVLLALSSFIASAGARDRPVAAAPVNAPIYILHVTVIDTETGAEANDRAVVISSDRIAEVADSQSLRVPAAAKMVADKCAMTRANN
jgi:hypothetical protein